MAWFSRLCEVCVKSFWWDSVDNDISHSFCQIKFYSGNRHNTRDSSTCRSSGCLPVIGIWHFYDFSLLAIISIALNSAKRDKLWFFQHACKYNWGISSSSSSIRRSFIDHYNTFIHINRLSLDLNYVLIEHTLRGCHI